MVLCVDSARASFFEEDGFEFFEFSCVQVCML
jgi:hypothetical protein